jgi:hypothetical protein
MAIGNDGNIRVGLLLAAVVGVEAALILGAFGLGSEPITGGDGLWYYRLAENLVDHGRFSFEASPPYRPTVFRTPGYPAFLALTFAAGRSPLSLRVAQFVLLWLTSWLIYRLGAGLLGQQAALAGALLCAVYEPLAIMAYACLTETLSTFLGVGFIALAMAGARGPLGALGLGLVTGAAALVRPSMAPLGGIAALLPLAYGGVSLWRKASLALLACAGFALCVLPWAVRNYALTKRFIPLAVGSGYSRYVSAKQYAGEVSYMLTIPEWEAIVPDGRRREEDARMAVSSGIDTATNPASPPTVRIEILVDRSYAEDAARTFRRLPPVRILRSVPVRLFYLWATGDWLTGPFHRVLQALHIVLAACALAGLWVARLSPRNYALLLLIPAYLTAVHLVYHVETRYSFPARPFLLLFAGVALASFFRFTYGFRQRPRHNC